MRPWLTILVAALLVSLSIDAARGEMRKPVTPSAGDKCPVCGMFVKKFPDWTAQMIFTDGTYAVFDGAKDLFKAYHNLGRFVPGRRQTDIEAIYVTDYYSLRPVDGRKAYYVIGSNVYGPMGRELIPFSSQGDAKEFLTDHKGREILSFEGVKPDHLRGLD